MTWSLQHQNYEIHFSCEFFDEEKGVQYLRDCGVKYLWESSDGQTEKGAAVFEKASISRNGKRCDRWRDNHRHWLPLGSVTAKAWFSNLQKHILIYHIYVWHIYLLTHCSKMEFSSGWHKTIFGRSNSFAGALKHTALNTASKKV